MANSNEKQVDWQWFDSLSESEQIDEMKKWDYETWIEYETREGLISEEEFWNYAHEYLGKLEAYRSGDRLDKGMGEDN